MKSQCIQSVEKAIGRKLGEGESKRIEERIAGNVRELARTDPNFPNLTREERLLAAAQKAFQQDAQAAAKAAQRKASNVLTQLRETSALTARAAEIGGKKPFHRALFERLRIIDNSVNAVRKEILSELVDTVQAAEPGFLGLLYDRQGISDFVHEVFSPGSTGNAVAQRGAKAYVEVFEKIRQRQNAAGADIGKLDYNYLPQPHDVGKVARAGKDAWVEATFGKVDRSRYRNEDGTLLDDAQLREFLGAAYDTISTEGRNKLVPSPSAGRGGRASAFDEAHRSIHFKDAESYLAYQNEFGRAGSVFEAIQAHVGSAAKNIALLEEFGANPNATFQLLKSTAEKADNARGVHEGTATLDNAWETLTGVLNSPVSPDLAQIGNSVRAFVAATKLQGVVLSAIPDLASVGTSAIHNGLPLGKVLRNILGSFGGATHEELARLGVSTDYIAGELSRFHADTISTNFWSKLGGLTNRLSLIDRWTNSLRAGYALSLHSRLADLVRTDWAGLHERDRRTLQSAGVSEADWKVWQQATPADYRGQKLLNADAIRQVSPHAIDSAVPGDIQSVRQGAADQIAKLQERNAQDAQFIQAREQRLTDARNALNRRVKEFAARRDAESQRTAATLKLRADELDAQLELARLYAEGRSGETLDAFNKRLDQALNGAEDRLRQIAERYGVERGKIGEELGKRKTQLEARVKALEERAGKTKPDSKGRDQAAQQAEFTKAQGELFTVLSDVASFNAARDVADQAKRSIDAVGSRVDAAAGSLQAGAESTGRQLGQVEGSIQRRLVEIRRGIRDAEREAQSSSDAKAREADARLAELKQELADFTARAQARQQARTGAISGIQTRLPNDLQAVRDRAVNQAITRLNGFVEQEARTAILAPDLNTRAGLTLGTKAGTVGGEFARSLLMFKSFPVAIINRYLQRLNSIPTTKGRLAYSAAHFSTLALLGGLSLELKDIIEGKDPRDIRSAKFWGAAAVQGGGLGIFGDVFYTGLGGDSRSGQANYSSLAGPVFGTAVQLASLSLGNVGQAARDKNTNLAAELFRFGAQNTPLIRLWYIRAALNHAILDDVQESLAPGYLRRMRQRAEQDWGQRYWYEPGATAPSRAPDLSAAVGGGS